MAESKKPFFVPQEMQQAPEVTVAPKVEKPAIEVKDVVKPAKVDKEPYLPVINVQNIPSNFLPYPKGTEI